MISYKILSLWFTILLNLNMYVSGLPSYEDYSNDQYDYEYEDDELPINEEESQDTNVHRPSIVSTPVMLDVDNGMTIRLPCLVDKLPGKKNFMMSFVENVSCLQSILTILQQEIL